MPPHYQNVSPARKNRHAQQRQQSQGRQRPKLSSSSHPHQQILPPRPEHTKTPPRYPSQYSAGTDLRTAFKTSPNRNNNHNNNNHNYNHNNHNNDDARSTSSASGGTGATPSSVYMPSPSVALSRDMSDISGLSGGTSRNSSSGNGVGAIPGHIFDPRSFQGPWRQAYVLSNTPPEQHVHRPSTEGPSKSTSASTAAATTAAAAAASCGTASVHATTRDLENNGTKKNGNINHNKSLPAGPSIWVARNDVVEIFDNLQASLGLDRLQISNAGNRIPVMILLMDPTKHTYELMQVWVDRANDSIRDLVHVLQHKLPMSSSSLSSVAASTSSSNGGGGAGTTAGGWNQAYDGIFQVRGNRFTQLINIIRLVKYDVQPHEILIAKPWAMTAKMTIGYATSAIRHLTKIGTINPHEDNSRVFRPKSEDAPLLLSKHAQDRAYFPEGILNHHHAIQFITFSPPFESLTPGNRNSWSRDNSARGVSPGRTSIGYSQQSHDDDQTNASSLGSDGMSQYGLGHTGDTMAVLKGVQKRLSPESSPTSVMNVPHSQNGRHPQIRGAVLLKGVEIEGDPSLSLSRRKQEYQPDLHTNQPQADESDRIGSPQAKGLFSRLNCCRNKDNKDATHHGLDNGGYNPHDTSFTSLSEEEEQRWLAYSMRPIAEDQSLTGGQSVVSSSAPLLTLSPSAANSTQAHSRHMHHQQQQRQYRSSLSPSSPQPSRLQVGSGRGYKGLSTEYEV